VNAFPTIAPQLPTTDMPGIAGSPLRSALLGCSIENMFAALLGAVENTESAGAAIVPKSGPHLADAEPGDRTDALDTTALLIPEPQPDRILLLDPTILLGPSASAYPGETPVEPYPCSPCDSRLPMPLVAASRLRLAIEEALPGTVVGVEIENIRSGNEAFRLQVSLAPGGVGSLDESSWLGHHTQRIHTPAPLGTAVHLAPAARVAAEMKQIRTQSAAELIGITDSAATSEGASIVSTTVTPSRPVSSSSSPFHKLGQEQTDGDAPDSSPHTFESAEFVRSLPHVSSPESPTQRAEGFPSGVAPHKMPTTDGLGAVLRATISTMYTHGGITTRLVLHPESLGTVVVHLSTSASGTAVQIVVSSAETLKLIEHTIDALHAELRSAGVPAEAIALRLQDTSPLDRHSMNLPAVAPIVQPIGDDRSDHRRQRQRHDKRRRTEHNEHTHFEHFM
jgi:hypothetical protein